jgi:hypothetical protein
LIPKKHGTRENALRAVPTNACFFNTSTNFSCVKMWGPASAHYFIPPPPGCHSCLPISVSAETAWLFKRFRSREPLVLDISKPSKNCQVSKKNRCYLANSNSPRKKGEIIRNRLRKLVASTLKIYEVDAHILHPWSNAQPTHVVQGRRTKDSICGWYTSKISTLCLSRWIQRFCTATQFSSS